jgi:PAS domain S-box-containing protein
MLQNLAEHIAQIVLVVTEQGRGEYFNAYWETYTGLSEAESCDFGWMRAFHRDDLERLTREFRRTRDSGGREFEARLRRGRDGTDRRHVCRCSMLGQPAEGGGIVICCTDVEEWREAETRAKEQGALLALALRAQDEERRKTVYGLHDSAGQYLVVLQMKLDGLQRSALGNTGRKNPIVDECRELVKRCCREIRAISHQLYPPLLDDLGLESAVHLYLNGFIERTKARVELEIEPNLGRLDRDLEIALFRVVEQSLASIHRQCAGKDVRVKIGAEPTSVFVELTAPGAGAPQGDKFAAWSDTPGGAGLATLRQRIVEAGGVFEILPRPSGIAIRAAVPRRALVAYACD